MSYPSSLKHFISGVLQASKNTYELATQTNRAEVLNGGTISVNLPSNTIINFDSLMMKFDYVTSDTSAVPDSAHDLIQRLELLANGRPIAVINNYNHVYKLLQTFTGEDHSKKRKVLEGGASGPTLADGPIRMYLTNMLGLSSIKPSMLDTGLIGNLELRLQLASRNISPGTGTDVAPVSVDFKLKNISFLCETIQLPSVYYEAHQAVLNQGGSLPVLLDTYRVITQSGVNSANSTTRFSVSSQSINWILASKIPYFNAAQGNAIANDPNRSWVFKRDGSDLDRWRIKVNNQEYPNYSSDNKDAWFESQKVANILNDTLGGVDPKIVTTDDFLSKYWVCGCSLSIPNSGSDRFISGLNSEGSAVEVEFTASGNGAGSETTDLVVVGMTSALNVFAGKQIELID